MSYYKGPLIVVSPDGKETIYHPPGALTKVALELYGNKKATATVRRNINSGSLCWGFQVKEYKKENNKKISKDKTKKKLNQKPEAKVKDFIIRNLIIPLENDLSLKFKSEYSLPTHRKELNIDFASEDKKSKKCILIETKKENENLDKHYKQIEDYYGNPSLKNIPYRLLILTNGKEFRIYSSMVNNGQHLDEKPFQITDNMNYVIEIIKNYYSENGVLRLFMLAANSNKQLLKNGNFIRNLHSVTYSAFIKSQTKEFA